MSNFVQVQAPKTTIIQSQTDASVLLVTANDTTFISVDSGGGGGGAVSGRPCIDHLISTDLTILAGTSCLGRLTEIGPGVSVTIEPTGEFLLL